MSTEVLRYGTVPDGATERVTLEVPTHLETMDRDLTGRKLGHYARTILAVKELRKRFKGATLELVTDDLVIKYHRDSWGDNWESTLRGDDNERRAYEEPGEPGEPSPF